MMAMKIDDKERFPIRPLAFAVALSLGLVSVPVHNAYAEETVEPTLSVESAPDSVSDSALSDLTFEEMLRLVMADNPVIDIADARIDQATQQSFQNRSYRFPKIEVSGAAGPEHNDPVPSEESGKALTAGRNLKLNVTQLLYDGGISRSEYQRSLRLENAAKAEAQIVAEELFMDVAVNYIDYWRYQVELSEAEEFVATMQKLVGDLDKMYQGGAASKLEVDFAKARLASARGLASGATASLNNAFSELEYLLPGLQKFEASAPETFNTIDLLPLSEYLEHGAVSNSGFLTNGYSIEATQLRVKAQKGQFKPTLDFELSGSIIDDEGGPSVQRDKVAAKLLLSYTLYNGGVRRGGVRRAEAQLRELQAERIQLERDVFRAIDQAYNGISAARITLDALMDEVASNEELQRLNRQNLALGTINIIELIDVEERLFNARARKNEIVASMHQQYLDLAISAGYTSELMSRYSIELATE